MFIRKFSSISLDSYVIFSRISQVKNTQNTTYLPTLLTYLYQNFFSFFSKTIYDFSMQIYIFLKKLAFVSFNKPNFCCHVISGSNPPCNNNALPFPTSSESGSSSGNSSYYYNPSTGNWNGSDYKII